MILEREAASAAVAEALDRARGGSGGALFLSAEAGLGKTTLLEHARSLADPDFLIGVGRGDPMETSLPFGLLAQAIEALGGREVLERGLIGSSAAENRSAHFYAVLRWLEEASASPVVLLLDDLHWADADSLALLCFVCRRIGTLPVAVIGSLRPWPQAAHRLACALARGGYATLQALAPLSEPATEALLVARAPGLSPTTVAQARQLCGGNPLLLEALAEAYARGEGPPGPRVGALIPGSHELLLGRFFDLPPAGMALSKAASVLGGHFGVEVAAEVAQLGDAEVDAGLEALCRSGLVRQGAGGWLEFVHPLFRQVLYDDLAPPLRARLHARAFSALLRRGMQTQAAGHALRAHLVGDPQAIAVLEQAGRGAVAAGAVATGVHYLQVAVSFAGASASPGLLLGLGEALVATGRAAEAISFGERALAHPDAGPELKVEALRHLGRALAATGACGKAKARFAEAVALAEDADPEAAVAVLLDHALLAWLAGGPAASLPLAARARAMAEGAEASLRARVEAAWGFIALQSGDAAGLQATEAAARGLEAASPEELAGAWGALSNVGLACILTERLEEADGLFRVVREAAQAGGATRAMATLATGHAYGLGRMGRLAEALAVEEVACSLLELAPSMEAFASVGMASILFHLGRLEDSEAWAARGEAAISARGESHALLYLLDLRGQRHLREGRVAQACECYASLEATLARLGIREPCAPTWARHAMGAYLAADRLGDARRILAWLEECARALPCRWPRIAIATARAWLAERRGDRAGAEAHFRVALGLHEEVVLPIQRIETLLEYGAFLRRVGQAVAARGVLGEALALAESIGAAWLGGFVKAELAIAGGRRRRGYQHPCRLTAAEERVAALAAEGASNKEVACRLSVSVGTVESHLHHIYAKLGISTRKELILRGARAQELSPAG